MFLLLLLTFLFQKTGASPSSVSLDNAIIGQPYISCQRDRIVVEVITERLFTGKVFVKGDYSNPQCQKTFRNGAVVADQEKTDIFEGTVTRSREPYVEEQRGGEASALKGRPSSSLSNSGLSDTSSEPSDPGEKGENHEKPIQNGIIFPPDIAETFLLPRRNHSEQDRKIEQEEEEEGEWKGVGGASAGPNAVFGGTRGEELRIFGKGGFTQSSSTVPPSPQCAPTTCEPCNCEERRSRRATNSIRLEVPLNSCNSKRDRKLNPPSVVISLVAVVSFHDSFITKLDKAYHIQCAYAEAEKTVSTDLDVNMSDELELNGTIEAPTCDYLITDGHGNMVHNSLVGELVRHQWDCKGGLNRQKVLVHSCFVKDGSGQQFEVIDEHGCTVDQYMLQTPTYSEDGMSAKVDAYTFKFPDRATVDFKCNLFFCSKEDEECQQRTPPKCNLPADSNVLRRKRSSIRGASSMSIHSNTLTVFDIDSSKTDNLPLPASLQSFEELYDRKFCVSIASFGILISASTFFATICIAVIFSYFFLRFQHKFYVQD